MLCSLALPDEAKVNGLQDQRANRLRRIQAGALSPRVESLPLGFGQPGLHVAIPDIRSALTREAHAANFGLRPLALPLFPQFPGQNNFPNLSNSALIWPHLGI